MKIIVAGCIGFFVFMQISFGQNTPVDLKHPVYQFMKILESAAASATFLPETRPFSRADIFGYLSKVKTENAYLKNQIAYFLMEFAPLGQHQKKTHPLKNVLPNRTYMHPAHLFSVVDSHYTVALNPVFSFEADFGWPDSLTNRDDIFRRSSGGQAIGSLGDHIHFLMDFRDHKISGSRSFPDGHRLTWPGAGYAEGRGDHVFYDEAIAELIFDHRLFNISFGKNENQWGPNFSGSLALNDVATSYDQLKVQTKLGKLQFTYVHARLQAWPRLVKRSYRSAGVERQIFSKKFLVAHRFELPVMQHLQLGVQETIVYGERELELAYLNPIMFFRSAEHHLGDDDNAALGFDIKLRWPQVGIFYSEFFLDDFSFSKLGTDWYGNKHAFSIGFRRAVPVFERPGLLQIEHVAIRPYVYTHTFPINVYSHFDDPLGHALGPNSRGIFADFQVWWQPEFQNKLQFGRSWHGANLPSKNNGGDIDTPFHVHDAQDVNFLGGIIEKQTWFEFTSRYRMWHNVSIAFQFSLYSWQVKPAETHWDKRFRAGFYWLVYE